MDDAIDWGKTGVEQGLKSAVIVGESKEEVLKAAKEIVAVLVLISLCTQEK